MARVPKRLPSEPLVTPSKLPPIAVDLRARELAAKFGHNMQPGGVIRINEWRSFALANSRKVAWIYKLDRHRIPRFMRMVRCRGSND